MGFTDREKLTVMEIDKDQETVEFDVLERLILKRPSNMIYCVDKNGGDFGYY
jgi:hypothetical protein